MRAHEFITEEIDIEDELNQSKLRSEQLLDKQIVEISKLLKAECAPYITEIGGLENALFNTPIFRGVARRDRANFGSNPINLINSRYNRKPSSTPIEVHNMLDDWFMENHYPAFRSVSLFATGNFMSASEYGTSMVILPIGNYDYCWSPKYDDLFLRLVAAAKRSLYASGMDYTALLTMPGPGKISLAFTDKLTIDNFMKGGDYQVNTELSMAIYSQNEIMFACRSAYVLDYDWIKAARARINSTKGK